MAVISRIKFIFFFSFLILSCGEKISVAESELINGMDMQRFIRTNQFSGTITVMYMDGITIKSKRKYVKGKKNGTHLGWWPDGTKRFHFTFRNDLSNGKHSQWHQNGQLFTLKQFNNGLEQGRQKAWDIDGELMYNYIYNDGRKYGIQGSVLCNSDMDLAKESD